MREDYQEQLDKMFPQGYVIVYTFPDSDQMRCHYWNPKQYIALGEYRDIILDKSEDIED